MVAQEFRGPRASSAARATDEARGDSASATPSHGLVHAVGLFGQIVAAHLVGASSTTSADAPIFADAALALELVDVAQVLEERCVTPDLRERLLLHVAGDHVEVAARLYVCLLYTSDAADDLTRVDLG